MANELFGFEWQVSAHYRWTEIATNELILASDGPGAGWVLESHGEGENTYKPLEVSGLYRQFAELAPERQSVMSFAVQFGCVGTVLTKSPPDWAPEVENENARQVVGETLSSWAAHILVMKDAVTVWDLIAAGDHRSLNRLQRQRQLFTSVPGHRGREMPLLELPHEDETLADLRHIHDDPRSPYMPGGRVATFDGTTPGAAFESARSLLVREVNDHLSEQAVSPRLLSISGQDPQFYVVPRTLLGAMWLQFAEAISQQKQYRRCRECTTPFEISRGGKGSRSDKQFCTAACKTEYHNSKRRNARDLRAEGGKLREIAKHFETDVPTIRKWLGEDTSPKKRKR